MLCHLSWVELFQLLGLVYLMLSALCRPFNPFQPEAALHMETNQLIYTVNQMTGFYMKSNTALKLRHLPLNE